MRLNAQAAAKDWVWLAHIRRPQGRKGEVFADLLTDFPEKFSERKKLWLLPSNSEATANATPVSAREFDLIAH
jgi:16S rRNA processing protein RimM